LTSPDGGRLRRAVSKSRPSPGPRKPTWTTQWAILLGIWTFVGLLRATERYLRGSQLEPDPYYTWWSAVGNNLALAYLWAALTPLVMRVARRFSFERTPLVRLVPVHLLAAAGVALLYTVLANILYKLVLAPDVTWDEFFRNFTRSAVIAGPTRLGTYLEIVGVTWGLDSYRRYRQREIEASRLQTQLAGARLDALKLQLHPAFVFNALNTILPLIYKDPLAAARTVVQLGDLLRLSLKGGAARLVTLKEELAFLKLYLRIERTRLQDRLSVSFSIEPETLAAAVPNLILQPLVETAIAQGVSAHMGPGSIEVRAIRREATLVLEVTEKGKGDETDPGNSHADWPALVRTQRRLEHLYPGGHRFERSRVFREGTGVGEKVTLAIPFEPLRKEGKAQERDEAPVRPGTLPAEEGARG